MPRLDVARLQQWRCRGCSERSARRCPSAAARSARRRRRRSRSAASAAARAAGRALPRAAAAASSRSWRAILPPRPGSRAGSGSWRDRTRRGRAPRARRRIDQPGEDLARLLGQPVRREHAAAQDLGLVVMLDDAVELLRRHQRRDRREVAVLEEVVEGVAVVRRLDLMRRLGRTAGAERPDGASGRRAAAPTPPPQRLRSRCESRGEREHLGPWAITARA